MRETSLAVGGLRADLLVMNGIECLIYRTKTLWAPSPAHRRVDTSRLSGEVQLVPEPLLISDLVLTLVGHEVCEQKCSEGILDDVER